MKDRAYNRKIGIILQNKNLPFFVFALLWLLLHFYMPLKFGDDLFYSHVLDNQSYFNWVINKYLTHNSRIITESILVLVLHIGDWLWKILNIFMLVVIAKQISEFVFGEKATVQDNWIVVCVIGMYPFIDMASAGWGATSVNYTWPLALGLYALNTIKHIVLNKPIKVYTLVLVSLATFIAGNVEQMACVLLAFTIIALMYCKITNNTLMRFYGLSC